VSRRIVSDARPRLSICIATYQRGAFIGETLDSILRQLTAEVEVVVVDGASSDDTPNVVAKAVSRHPGLRYHRESRNSGVDADYDKAVGYATGDYCWLMTDDDVLAPGAVRVVLDAIESGPDLVVANAEVWNVDFSRKLEASRLAITADTEYDGTRKEQFFVKTASYLSFIGSVVIKREQWLARDRVSYYGTLFVHVGVIFQKPSLGNVKIIAKPLIMIRNGNAMWTPRGFEIWSFKWPRVLWSFADLPESAKRAVCPEEPWRRFRFLLFHRALGSYSLAEFETFLADKPLSLQRVMTYLAALCPGALANFLVVLHHGMVKRFARVALYDVLRSRHATVASRLAARALGVLLR
jgi:abequosyltransferase